MPKVLISDSMSNVAQEIFKKNNISVDVKIGLSEENIAYDINGYAKAPPSFRVWGGGTVEPHNIKLLLPWLEWAYIKVKGSYA